MKTFAAAVLAASATAFDAMAVPDFIAGFMYGMTGDNQLTEIEACFQGGQQIVTDAQTAIADFSSGSWFAGLKELGTVWNEVGSAMTTCQGMDDDIAAIEQWATIFTDPARLAKTVSKHWLFHGSEIKADIAKEEADWSAANYFQAGVDTADALTLAVGPIEQATAINMPLDAPLLFVGGLLEGLVADNHLSEISTCALDAEGVVGDVEKVISDFKAGHKILAANAVRKLIKDFPAALTACEGMNEDIAALESWAQIFTEPSELTATIAKHMVLHHSEITSDLHAVEVDWSAAEYYKSGQDAAALLTVAVGPVEVPQPTPTLSNTNDELLGLDLLALPEFAAGFVYGFVGENHLMEMQACYAGVSPLYTFLADALKDIESFKIIAALEQLELFVYHFQLDVAPCTQMGDDIAAIEQWATIFTNPTQLVSTATKHYLLHKKAISADITAIKADWAAGSDFAAGRAAADLITVLLGSVE